MCLGYPLGLGTRPWVDVVMLNGWEALLGVFEPRPHLGNGQLSTTTMGSVRLGSGSGQPPGGRPGRILAHQSS